jgi:hypothetical protein
MAFQFSVGARNAALDAIETAAGTAPTLTIRTGSVPANCAAARSGTVLATLVLSSDWLTTASNGSKSISGTWQDLAADATGTAAHFSVDQGATCHIQGTVTAIGGGGDMTIDNTSLATGQQVAITAFNLTAGGA